MLVKVLAVMMAKGAETSPMPGFTFLLSSYNRLLFLTLNIIGWSSNRIISICRIVCVCVCLVGVGGGINALPRFLTKRRTRQAQNCKGAQSQKLAASKCGWVLWSSPWVKAEVAGVLVTFPKEHVSNSPTHWSPFPSGPFKNKWREVAVLVGMAERGCRDKIQERG